VAVNQINLKTRSGECPAFRVKDQQSKLERKIMRRYIILIQFTEQGAKTLKKSTERARAFKDAATKAGVKVELQYWTLGSIDGVVILSADSETKALKLVAGLASAGNVKTQTLQALTDAEFDEIAK
jgi:uncharacterized protein with GYD domain